MLLGARIGSFGGGAARWSNPYIANGLVAMWDGVWNDGEGGKHNANASAWTDIIGGKVATPTQSLVWTDDSPTFDGTQYFTISSVADIVPNLTDLTVEAVVDEYSTSVTNSGVIGFSNGTSRFLCCFFGYNVNRTNGSQSWNYRGTSPVRIIYSDSPLVNYAHTTALVVSNGKGNGYLNGNLRTYTTDVSAGTVNPGTENYIGFLKGFKAITGKIHCIRFYSRSLSAEEVAANHAVDKDRFSLRY